MRIPGIGRLARFQAWWNPFWIQEFELASPNRPAICEELLAERLPAIGHPASGYVWPGGFTIRRITPWANAFRPVATGVMTTNGAITAVHLRVALGRHQAYSLALLYLVFGIGGAILLGEASASFLNGEGSSPALLFVPAAWLFVGAVTLILGRTGGGRTGSVESDFFIDYLRGAIDAEISG